ncbi:hypothetical protein Tco_0140611 [Tanacetum coccineum]
MNISGNGPTLILLITLLGIPLDRYPLGNSLLRMLCGASTIPYCPKSNQKTSNLQLLKTAGFKPCKKKSNEFDRWTVWGIVPLRQCHELLLLKWSYKAPTRAWYDTLSKFLLAQGFSKGVIDPTLGIFINQSKYANEILKKFDLHKSDPVDTPMVERNKMDENSRGPPIGPDQICGMIGSSDVPHAIIWSSKKQTSTSILSTEAEYIAMSGCCAPNPMDTVSNYPDLASLTIGIPVRLSQRRFLIHSAKAWHEVYKAGGHSKVFGISGLWSKRDGFKVPDDPNDNSGSSTAYFLNLLRKFMMSPMMRKTKLRIQNGSNSCRETSWILFCQNIRSDMKVLPMKMVNPSRATSNKLLWVFNSLVHSLRALSTLRRSGLRTASAAMKPCQGDSSEFYLITGSIYTD